MKRLPLLIFIIFMTMKAVAAADADSALVEHTTLARVVGCQALRNPAVHGDAYQRAFSPLALGIDT